MNGKQSKKLVAHARLGGLARGAIASRVAEPLRQLGITPAAQVILPAITANNFINLIEQVKLYQ